MRKLPEEVKKQRGTLRKCRTNPDAPKPKKGWPEMPERWDEEHRQVFTQFCQKCDQLGDMLAESDQYSVILFVESYVQYKKCVDVISQKGFTYEVDGRNGKQIKTRPEVHLMNQFWKQCYMMLAHFGFSPAARQQLKVVPTKADDKPEAQKRYEAKLRKMGK